MSSVVPVQARADQPSLGAPATATSLRPSSNNRTMLNDAGATRSWLQDDGCAPIAIPSAARIETA